MAGKILSPGRVLSKITQGLTYYFFYLLLVTTIGPLLFGFHLAELNAPQDVLTCNTPSSSAQGYWNPFSECIPMSTAEFSLVSSVFTVGGFIGALGVGYPAGRYGRLKAMHYTTIPFIVGPIAEALAPNVPIMVLGRFASGLGAGAAITVAPIYISEISPPSLKGLFGAFTQIMCNFGILVAQNLGLFLSKDYLWRIILASGGLIAFLQTTGLVLATESPIWLAENGSPTEAKKVLQKLRGPSHSIVEETSEWHISGEGDEEGADQSLLGETSNVGYESVEHASPTKNKKKETVGIVGVLRDPQYRTATLTVMVIMVAQQFTGINSIIMYGVKVLSALLPTSSTLLNVFIALLNLIITIVCAPLSDKFGRKKALVTSIVGMGISSLILGIAIKNNIAIMSAVTVLTFVGSFGIGLGPIPFILASELVGAEAVGATQSWALAANWTATFLVAQFFPILNETFGHGNMYYVFSAFALIFAIFVTVFVPETKGKKNAADAWARNR